MNDRKDPILYIVIPCYNEQEVLPITAPLFLQKINDLAAAGKISPDSRVLFVNDGSRDRTWEIINELAASDEHYVGICQSRNRGHQNAVLAGLMEAKDRCDITISIDCDGQDDINAMDGMVDAYRDGCDVVYGVRSKRDTDTFFKRFTAESFYKLLNAMGAEVVYNHADYRLMSARVLQEFAKFKEVNLFLRGMVPLVGFKSTSVAYERHERIAGESHYPLSKMLSLAFDGITSLSIKPIRFITGFGVIVALISFIGVIWAMVEAILGLTVSGWASMTSIICFVSGVQLICLGVIGEYIGKIYMEIQAPPALYYQRDDAELWRNQGGQRMSRQVWKGSTLLNPEPPVLVSCGSPEKPNLITVGWCGTICTQPPMLSISVRPERYSHKLIKESGEFVVNLPTESLVKAIDWCGVKSGRDVDKFAAMHLTAAPAAKLGTVLLEESPVNLECKVTQVIPLGSHDLFLAECVAVDVDEKLLDENGKLCLNKAKLIVYSHGDYLALGRKLGSFGYSVRKKKKPIKK